MTRYEHGSAAQLPSRQVSSRQAAAARQARDDGLRRVRKLTFRIALAAAAAGAFIGAKFAHLTAPSVHLPSSLSGTGSATGGGTFSGSSSSGITSSSGISSVSGGGLTTSGGS